MSGDVVQRRATCQHCGDVYLFKMFGNPKKVVIYEAKHALNAQARMDRDQWLATRLKLRHIDTSALGKIPELN